MNIHDCITTADRAASLVWQVSAGTHAFGWRDSVGRLRAQVAAQWVFNNRGGTAADLYGFLIATAGEDAKSWDDVDPAVRVACETFRATFLTLVTEAETRPWREKPNPRVTGICRAPTPQRQPVDGAA